MAKSMFSWIGGEAGSDDEEEDADYSDEVYSSRASEEGEGEDAIPLEPIPINEDTYGMSVCALVRDTTRIAKGESTFMVRTLRLIMTIGLLVLTLFFQVFICAKVKTYVCARFVHDIRISYDLYEETIYGKENTFLTVNQKMRGRKEAFPGVAEATRRLETLSAEDQDAICKIPLSQPYFFGAVLVIWTLTCLAELRRCLRLFWSTILMTGNCTSMADALDESDELDKGDMVIANLTVSVKAVLVLLVFAPWAVLTGFLLWVGCRWLLATNDFGDLILNAVALEFILMLKETVFHALMPIRNKIDLSKTFVKPYPAKQTLQNGCSYACSFLSSIWYFVLAVIWVTFYMLYIQAVLPDYNWDVREPCEQYIRETTKV